MIIVLLAVFGLIFGSFVNALVWRFHEQAELTEQTTSKKLFKKPAKAAKVLTADQLSMVKGRSMCSHCHHELAAKDLVPLFSWLYLRGKCRYCKVRIQDNPLVEVVLPILFVVSYLAWPMPMHGAGVYTFGFWLIFLVAFMALAVYDLRWYLLPDRIVYPLIGLALIELLGKLIWFHGGWPTALGAFWGVLIDSGIFYALYILSNGTWIGGGDVKLGIVLGLLAGGPLMAVLVLFIASVAGTLVSLPLLATGKAARNFKLPFGPFLLVSTFVVVVFGVHIIGSYYQLVGL